MHTGYLLKTVRNTLGITQREVGEKIFKDKSTLSRIENAKIHTSLNSLNFLLNFYSKKSTARTRETKLDYNNLVKTTLINKMEDKYLIPDSLKESDVSSEDSFMVFVSTLCDLIKAYEGDKDSYSTASFLMSNSDTELMRNLSISYGFQISDSRYVDNYFRYDLIRRIDMYDDEGNYRTFRWLYAINNTKNDIDYIVHRTYAEYSFSPEDLEVKAFLMLDEHMIPLDIEYAKERLSPESKSDNVIALWAFKLKMKNKIESGGAVAVFLTSKWPNELRLIKGTKMEVTMSLVPYTHGVKRVEYGVLGECSDKTLLISRLEGVQQIKCEENFKKTTLNKLGINNEHIDPKLGDENIYLIKIDKTNCNGLIAVWERKRKVNDMLMKSISKDNIELAKEIIQKGEFNKEDRAIILATRKNYIDIVKMLLERNSNVNVKDVYGRTSLSWALELGFKELAVMLVMAGGTVAENGEQLWFGH